MRRSTTDRIADLEARAAKLKADSDRRLSVASDPCCALMFDAEKALRYLAAYMGREGGRDHEATADSLKGQREAYWSKIKAVRDGQK